MLNFLKSIFSFFSSKPIGQKVEAEVKYIISILEMEYDKDQNAKNAIIDSVIVMLQNYKNPPNQQ